MTTKDEVAEWLVYYLTRPLCWLGFHTTSCRGRRDHWPLRGWWRSSGSWERFT